MITGNDKEQPPSYEEHALPQQRHHYACVSLNYTDKLRMIFFPEETVRLVRNVIQNTWAKGVQRELDYHGSHEFKLFGNPWNGQASDAVPARTLMVTVLRELHNAGWQLLASTDVMKKPYDKDTLFFRSVSRPPPSSFFAISFNEGDKLRVIQGGEPEINAVKNILGQRIQREEWKVPNVAYQFKMHGFPWYADGAETVSIRIVLLNILDTLAAAGWEFHASVDLSMGQNEGGSDSTDTWFFRKVKS
ncbi:hypothetical protein AURDEDRAFT_114519 [Auricularia subglabra TFB-10046 SS5]|nr:hypothetical protein AURDEDRAFT_114519 [Auricularia subglabra TFB-10046 SS5]